MPEQDATRPVPYSDSHLSVEGTERFYHLDNDALEFFKTASGIKDEEGLRTHIITVQREAYKLHAYPCIASFEFTNLRLARLPGYSQLLELGRKRKNPILVDIGCCFGNDIRKAILDGYPVDSVIAVDNVPEFWALGHRLFNTTPQTFPVPFLNGDVFDPDFLTIVDPVYTQPDTPRPKLSEAATLNELHGQVSVVSICAVFHLFGTKTAHVHLARAIAGLLSPEPGSMIIGVHRGNPEEGSRAERFAGKEYTMFYHSPESWSALWDGEIFEKGTVKVDTRLVGYTRWAVDGSRENFWFMEWSVTRI